MTDPFGIPGNKIPRGVVYQWCSYSTGIVNGWTFVPFERHKDWFDHSYLSADGSAIVYGGLCLMEKPEGDVQKLRQEQIDRAVELHKQSLEKLKQAAAEGGADLSIKIVSSHGKY